MMKPIALALVSVALLAPQTRDAARPRTGTAVLAGVVVTDEQTPRPVRGAVVTATISGGQWQVSTDDAGRFALINLPAGTVTLFARKPSYVTTIYGATRPGATSGSPIALAEGQRATDITLRMPRGAVITGTVFDDTGRPMQGVTVRITPAAAPAAADGARQPVPVALQAQTTDDRGVYRVFGLPPGDYLIAVQPRVTGAGDLRQPTNAELQWAEQQVRAATTPAAAAAAGPTAPPPPGPPVTYSNVFYPGTADQASATAVSVTAGQERAGIDISLRLVATSRLEGSVVDPSGQPAVGVQVALLSHAGSAPGTASDLGRMIELVNVGLIGLAGGTTSRTNAAGTFAISGVSPGKYTLMAATTRAAPAAGGSPAPAAPLWAQMDVEVTGQDVSGLALTLAPGMTVSGRFAFDGAPPADQARASLTVAAAGAGASATGSVTVGGANPVFSVTGLAPGRYRLAATLPSWTLKSAMLAGRDVVDLPFEIKPGEDVAGIVATFTRTTAEVAGLASDASNRPASDLSIVLFSTDRAMWFQGSRRLRAPVRADSNGRFTFTGLPAGEYYLAALTDAAPNDWYSTSFLDGIVASAIKITLTAGEKKTQDLRIAR
jgi:hypothetical protein